jgi:hypothetical protein
LRGGAAEAQYKSVATPGEVTEVKNKAAFDLALLEAGEHVFDHAVEPGW